jgi:hypothetical protein
MIGCILKHLNQPPQTANQIHCQQRPKDQSPNTLFSVPVDDSGV